MILTQAPQVRLRTLIAAVAAIGILLGFSTERIAIGGVAVLALGLVGAALCLVLNLAIMLCVVAWLTAKSQLTEPCAQVRTDSPSRSDLQARRSHRTGQARVTLAPTSIRALQAQLARKLGLVGTWHGSFRIVLAWACWAASNAFAFLGLQYENMYPFRAIETGGRYGAAWIAIPFVLASSAMPRTTSRERLSRLASLVWAALALVPSGFLFWAASCSAVGMLTVIELITPDPKRTRDTFRVWFCILLGVTCLILWVGHSLRKTLASSPKTGPANKVDSR